MLTVELGNMHRGVSDERHGKFVIIRRMQYTVHVEPLSGFAEFTLGLYQGLWSLRWTSFRVSRLLVFKAQSP